MSAKQPDVTREKILDAAFQEIYKHGFQAASLSNILAKTGLTKGADWRCRAPSLPDRIFEPRHIAESTLS